MLRLRINPTHPQPRHITRAADILRSGGIALYPTDTTYGLGCDIFSKRSIERIYQLRSISRRHPLSFLCADLSEIARYAVVENENYRILRQHTPGKYTFILPASREVPKIVQSKRRTVGIRIPESEACLALLRELGHPIISTTALEGDIDDEQANTTDAELDVGDPEEMISRWGRSVDLILDGETLSGEPSTVIDLTGTEPELVRAGAGDTSWLG